MSKKLGHLQSDRNIFIDGELEYVPSTERHGPYICSQFGCTVADFYTMSHPDGRSTANGGPSKPVLFLHEMADPNAAEIAHRWNCHNALVTALEEMLAAYWGNEGDGGTKPKCIVQAEAALAKAKEEAL